VQEDSERADPYPAGDPFIAGSVDKAWADDDIGDAKFFPVFGYDFVLFGFAKVYASPRRAGFVSTGHDSSNKSPGPFLSFE